MKHALQPPSQNTRIHERLMEYWTSRAGWRNMPLESDMDTDGIADIWDHCFLVRVGRDGTFLYQYLGSALAAAYGDNLTGREICESLLYPHPEPLFRTFERVRDSGQPIHDDNQFTNSSGMVIKYRSCVLPLAVENNDKVAYLIGAMNWKAY